MKVAEINDPKHMAT